MSFDPNRPYNELPGLPPEMDLETPAVLRACIGARAALAELRMAGLLIPNQTVLINSIPLLEAQASSEIENIVTTTDKLFRFAKGDGSDTDAATKETLRYRAALSMGYRSLADRPLATRTAVEICRIIKASDIDLRATPGTRLVNDNTGQVIYTPPEGAAIIRDKLADWERFLHAEGTLDPLIRMAVMHYQFEAIHPFIDGNGRTGRILNLLYLVERGLLDIPVLYLSGHIIQNKRHYYDLLLNVTTKGDWQGLVLFMIEAVETTARWSTRKIMEIRQLLEDTAVRMRADTPKIYSRDFAELIFVNPYCRIADVVEAGIARRQTASTYLKALSEAGILEERIAGRERLYINPRLLSLLSDRRFTEADAGMR